jgi:hypothetical protein
MMNIVETPRGKKISIAALLVVSLMASACPGCPPNPTTPSPQFSPFIQELVYSVTEEDFFTDDGYIADDGYLQIVTVCAEITCATALANANVTLDGKPLNYDPSKKQYGGNYAIAPGARFSLNVKVNGTDYTSSATQFTQFPTVQIPASGAMVDAGVTNNVTWSSGAPPAGATNLFAIWGQRPRTIVYPSGNKPLELPIGSNSYSLSPNWTSKAGTYYLGVGIGTSGTGSPISNAASGSGLKVAGIYFRRMLVF